MRDGIYNAIIEKVSLDDADRGMLTAWLFLDYGGSGQGFGGYALYLPKPWANHTMDRNYAGHFIWRCMAIGGVSRWQDLPGKTVRVRIENGLAATLFTQPRLAARLTLEPETPLLGAAMIDVTPTK